MSNLVLPFTFTPNTTIASAQVNANFAALQNGFNTNTRTIITAPTIFYVSPTGSDTVSGLNPSQPAATVNYILNLLFTIYDANNQPVTIQLSNGTYNQSIHIRGNPTGQFGLMQLEITGATAGSPGLVTINGNPAIHANNYSMLYLTNLTLQSTSDSILSTNFSTVTFDNLVFAAATNWHLNVLRAGHIYGQGNYQITGGGSGHAKATGSGSGIYLQVQPVLSAPPTPNQPVITLTGTPAWSSAFALATDNAVVHCNAQFSGGATGNRATASANGVIDTDGNPNALTTYFPGTVNPTTATGGQIT